jgi:hypothetical protein
MPPDVPWWLVAPPPDTPPLPWSGEVVPIDVPPVPVDVPIAGPVIHFIGEGEHAIWDNVWSWVKGTARTVASDVIAIENDILHAAIKVAEAYTGSLLEGLSGFINDTFSYAESGLQLINGYATDALSILFQDVFGIDRAIADLRAIVGAIDNVVIPGVFSELLGDIEGVYADLVGGIDLVKSWAIDTIYTPLDAEIRAAERAIPVWAEGALTDAKAYADDLVHSEALKRAAAIAGIAAAVASIATWVEECGDPMCQTIGPKTDLGKLLKGLALAGDVALFAELANLDEQGLADLLASIGARAAALAGEFESNFASGGETLGGLVAHAIGSGL